MLIWILWFLLGSAVVGDFEKAIVDNDLEAVRKCLKEGQDPNEIEDSLTSPLGYATTIEMIDLLVEFGAQLDRPDPQGKTALWYARQPDILRHLLKRGAQPDGVTLFGRTLLEELCKEYGESSEQRTKRMIDLLREHGAEYTPRCMISLGDLESFGKLNTEALDQNTLDGFFIHAVESDRAILAYWLLKSGANPNHDRSLLFKALRRRELTALLLDHGAEVSTEMDLSKYGRSGPLRADQYQPIHLASSSPDYLQGLAVLLERGADPNARDSDGETPLFWAIRATLRDRSNGMLPAILQLLEAGARNDIANHQGETPTMLVQSPKVPDKVRSIVTSKALR